MSHVSPLSDQIGRLQGHIDLLRSQHRKLQTRAAELEQQLAQTQGVSSDNHLATLLKTVASLFDSPTFSDITVNVSGRVIKAHRLVLASRGHWTDENLANISELTLDDLSYDHAWTIMHWLYTNNLEVKTAGADLRFMLDLLRACARFQLAALRKRCEELLTTDVNNNNVAQILIVADQVGAADLRLYSMDFLMKNWDHIPVSDFSKLPAQLLYDMLKRKSAFSLHAAIQMAREDVVFLYLIEHDADLPKHLNQPNEQGEVPLYLALRTKHENICKTLLSHGCNVDAKHGTAGHTLLHAAILDKDAFAAEFLIRNGASVNAPAPGEVSALHLTAKANLPVVARLLIEYKANVNKQDAEGNTPIHTAILSEHAEMVALFISNEHVDVNCRNAKGHTALWLALGLADQSFARTLVSRGCDMNLVSPTGDTMLHYAITRANDKAALFLIDNNCNVALANNTGTTPLHLAASKGLASVVAQLLARGAGVNVRDKEGKTPLMFAIAGKYVDIVTKLLQAPEIDVNVKDYGGKSALGLALEAGLLDLAERLVAAKADTEAADPSGLTLLHLAIMRSDAAAAIFLLEHDARLDARTGSNATPLTLAITHGVEQVVDALCVRGTDMNAVDDAGVSPIWMALQSRQEGIASILVRHGCDLACRDKETMLTALHRAIQGEDEFTALFLIRSGANVNDHQNPSGVAPVHLASELGQESVVRELMQHRADVNVQDLEGRTALHIAIYAKQAVIALLLLSHPGLRLDVREKTGERTPFGAALAVKDQNTAAAILRREPLAIEEANSRGMTYLHAAVAASDLDSFKFLLKFKVNVNARVRDATERTPLAIAVELGLEECVRGLLATGADVNIPDKSSSWSVAHVAASLGSVSILDALIKHGANVNAVDDQGATVLHAAVRAGHANVVKRILKEAKDVDVCAADKEGQTPLHTLARYPKDSAVTILEILHSVNQNLNVQDEYGNTPLHYAFLSNAGQLAYTLVMNGAQLNIPNKDGNSCFELEGNKRLLQHLIAVIPGEQPWIEHPNCQKCKVKFGTRTRKHHCRHCGRVVCSKCSGEQIVIKNESKPVRVCDDCFEVLSQLPEGATR